MNESYTCSLQIGNFNDISLLNQLKLNKADIYALEYIFNHIDKKYIYPVINDIKRYDYDLFLHSLGVACITALMSLSLGMKEEECILITATAFTHDVGKIKLPIELLNCGEKLSNNQIETIQKHPEYGRKYFINKNSIPEIFAIVAVQHHERCNERGYPYGLSCKEIHSYAKIIAICDVFEAYTACRVYHPKRSVKQGIKLIKEMVEKEYLDKEFSNKFIQIVAKK